MENAYAASLRKELLRRSEIGRLFEQTAEDSATEDVASNLHRSGLGVSATALQHRASAALVMSSSAMKLVFEDGNHLEASSHGLLFPKNRNRNCLDDALEHVIPMQG